MSRGKAMPRACSFGGTLTGTISLLRTDETNPFKLRYHPDHDDLTATCQTPVGVADYQREEPQILRGLHITFAASKGGELSPEAGHSRRTAKKLFPKERLRTTAPSQSYLITKPH